MAFPILLIEIMQSTVPTDELIQNIDYLYIFLWYFGTAFIATFFNVCVCYTSKIRFEGGNATLRSSIGFAFSKFFRILQWAFVSATVGIILYGLESMARNSKGAGRFLIGFLRSILAMAWNIVTLFVIPVMVYEDMGPMDAIKKSTDVLKNTWGESLIRHYGMGMIKGIVIILAVIVGIGFAYLLFPLGTTGMIIGLGLPIIVIITIILVFGVTDKIFTTALYVYGNTGQIPGGYNQNTMQNGFKVRKERARPNY